LIVPPPPALPAGSPDWLQPAARMRQSRPGTRRSQRGASSGAGFGHFLGIDGPVNSFVDTRTKAPRIYGPAKLENNRPGFNDEKEGELGLRRAAPAQAGISVRMATGLCQSPARLLQAP